MELVVEDALVIVPFATAARGASTLLAAPALLPAFACFEENRIPGKASAQEPLRLLNSLPPQSRVPRVKN